MFGDSKVFAIVDPMINPLGLIVERREGDTPPIDIGELGCRGGVGDKSVNMSDKGEVTLWNRFTGTDDESDVIVLFAAELLPTVVTEESEGCRIVDPPNIISSVLACQKFIFSRGVTFVAWIILRFPLLLLPVIDKPGSCLI
jgi:hypothetical protein